MAFNYPAIIQTLIAGTVTSIGSPANGLSISSTVLSLATATGSVPGALSAADWTTFNSKQGALTLGNLTSPTTGVTIGSGTGAVVGSGTTVSIQSASTSQPGLLTAADWNTFNGKQASGSYITALTSDVSASGPGSSAATVNSVGGSTAALVHSGELLANAATDANTASAIVKRDASGNFTAGTITASVTGHSSLDLALTGGTMSGDIAMGGKRLTNWGGANTVTGNPFIIQNGTTSTISMFSTGAVNIYNTQGLNFVSVNDQIRLNKGGAATCTLVWQDGDNLSDIGSKDNGVTLWRPRDLYLGRDLRSYGAISCQTATNVALTGDSYTIAAHISQVIFKPAGTIATLTITMPAAPFDGQMVGICSTQIVTAITHNANTGQTINGALTTLTANGFGRWQYVTADTAWYRIS